MLFREPGESNVIVPEMGSHGSHKTTLHNLWDALAIRVAGSPTFSCPDDAAPEYHRVERG